MDRAGFILAYRVFQDYVLSPMLMHGSIGVHRGEAFVLEDGRGSLKPEAAEDLTFGGSSTWTRRTSGGAGCAMTPRALH